MKIGLRKITWSDGSIGRYMIINNEVATGRVKITVKQWNQFKKFGYSCDEMTADTTEQKLHNVLS